MYAVPSDRTTERHFADVVNTAIFHVQAWYADQLDGYTFAVQEPVPQVCSLDQPAEYYEGEGGWWRVIDGLQDCAPVAHAADEHVWVIYVDADFRCGELRGELGAGGDGVTILHRGDLDGLSDPENYILCPDEGLPPRSAYGWIGGLAHEIGHAFGLPHPPGCEKDLIPCDYGRADVVRVLLGLSGDLPDKGRQGNPPRVSVFPPSLGWGRLTHMGMRSPKLNPGQLDIRHLVRTKPVSSWSMSRASSGDRLACAR